MLVTCQFDTASKADMELLQKLFGPDTTWPPRSVEEFPTASERQAAEPEKVAAPEPEKVAAPEPEKVADGPSVEDAVAAATKVVDAGNAALVKKALRAVGAERVSKLNEKKVPDFLEKLEELVAAEEETI